MVIGVLNLQKVLSKYENLDNIDLMPPIEDGAKKVQSMAKEFAPHDTGDLENSIEVKHYPKQISSVVYTSLEYAPHQEYGTINMDAQPYMNPAFNLLKGEIEADVEEHVKKEISKLKK